MLRTKAGTIGVIEIEGLVLIAGVVGLATLLERQVITARLPRFRVGARLQELQIDFKADLLQGAGGRLPSLLCLWQTRKDAL